MAELRMRRRSLPLLALVSVTGLLLRLCQIGSEGLWIDEAFSLWLARRPLGEMVRWVGAVDHHPPLYYALLRGWTAVFGTGEGGARSLSALFGVLTIPMIYLLGRRLISARVGLVAALILAISPFHVRFAQEARMYTLLTLQVSAATYAFIRLYDGSTGPGRASNCLCGGTYSPTRNDAPWLSLLLPWIGYVLATAAMMWTHNTAILFPVSANGLVLGRLLLGNRPRSRAIGAHRCTSPAWLRRWFAAHAVIGLLWLPWLPSFLSQATDVVRRFWLPRPTLGTVLSILGAFLYDFSPWPLLVTAILDAGLAALALVGLRKLDRRPARAVLVATVFVTPFVGQWLVSLWRPILYARTVVWASIPLYVMVAAGIACFEISGFPAFASRWARFALLVAVVVTTSAALGNYYLSFEKESWDDAAALVVERLRDGDMLLFGDSWGQIPFDYYFCQLYNPQSGTSVVEHGLPVDLFERGVLEPRMTAADLTRLDTLLEGRQRVWLVYSRPWYTDPDGLIPQALEATLNLSQQWTFQGLRVLLYVRN